MFWKRLFIIVGIMVILAFLAQLLAAPYLKDVVIKKTKQSLGIDLSVGNCAVNVLSRKVVFENVTIPNPDNKDDYLFKAKELSVDFYLTPLLFNKLVLQTISITNPELILYRDEKGTMKFIEIKKDAQEKAGPPQKPSALFGRLIINNGNLKFIDQRVSKPSTIIMLSEVNCDVVNNFSIVASKVITNIYAKGKIEGRGGFLIKGKGDFVSRPPTFDAEINLANVPLEEFSPYYGKNLSVVVRRGDLNMTTKARCDKGMLDVGSDITVENAELEPKGDPSQTIFLEMKTSDVIDFLKDENNTIRFSFKVSGNLNDPDFRWGPEVQRALKNAMLRSISDGVLRLLNKPAQVGEKIGTIVGGEAGENIKKIGKELQKIIGK